MRRAALWAMVLAIGCEQNLDVEVSTAVGGRFEREDPRAGWRNLQRVVDAVVPAATVSPSNDPLAVASPVHAPTDPSELEELVAAVRRGPIDEIAGPARRIAAAPKALWPELRARMLAPRKAPKGDYRSTLRAIGGDVPNRYGHFDLAWKKAHGHGVKLSVDWFEDLLAMPKSKLSPGLAPVYRDCVIETALLRGASALGRDPALTGDVVAALLEAAYLHEGTFRDEVGRAIQAIGDEAVPHLVLAAIAPVHTSPTKRREDPLVKRAEYAAVQLDRMDRLIPARAGESAAENPRRLAALLSAYGVAKTGEAAALMLEHADARVPAVREAARTAFAALVDGPPPKTISRSVRLLGGGTGRAQAFLNYREQAGIAMKQRLARDRSSLLEAPCEPETPDIPITPECLEQPARHFHAWIAWLDETRRAEEDNALAAAEATADPFAAVAAVDRLLAERPDLAAPERAVPIVRRAAEAAIAAGDAGRAAALLRKAAVLHGRDDDFADALRVRALLAEASVPDLPVAGREMLLRTALELRPEEPVIAEALAALPQRELTERPLGVMQLGFGVGLVSIAFGCLAAIGVRLRR